MNPAPVRTLGRFVRVRLAPTASLDLAEVGGARERASKSPHHKICCDRDVIPRWRVSSQLIEIGKEVGVLELGSEVA